MCWSVCSLSAPGAADQGGQQEVVSGLVCQSVCLSVCFVDVLVCLSAVHPLLQEIRDHKK